MWGCPEVLGAAQKRGVWGSRTRSGRGGGWPSGQIGKRMVIHKSIRLAHPRTQALDFNPQAIRSLALCFGLEPTHARRTAGAATGLGAGLGIIRQGRSALGTGPANLAPARRQRLIDRAPADARNLGGFRHRATTFNQLQRPFNSLAHANTTLLRCRQCNTMT